MTAFDDVDLWRCVRCGATMQSTIRECGQCGTLIEESYVAMTGRPPILRARDGGGMSDGGSVYGRETMQGQLRSLSRAARVLVAVIVGGIVGRKP